MASISSSPRLGNASASSLIRSSASLQNEINSYNDSLAAYEYELSPKTAEDFAKYQDYLTGRINNLQSTGSVTDAQKALTLTRTLTSAVHSNVSSDIQRENIQVMSGNASLQDKYSTIVSQYTRAMGIGDLALAQSLESQAYSVSQSIQYQAQQAAAAGKALSEANATAQGNIVTSLDDSIKQLNNDVKNLGVKDLNKVTQAWVKQNSGALKSMGVIIPDGAQPNYFNLIEGVQAAKYNALVLKAQLQAPTNPSAAQNTAYEAAFLKNGATKIPTLAGSLTLQEIQQAAQDPAMFAYDNASGQYKRTTQTGYQYINGQVAPTYSGLVDQKKSDQIYFLNANQTANLVNLGLTFSAHDHKGTGASDPSGLVTGSGVTVQLSENSPQWLRSLLGENGTTKAFTDKAGNIQFEAPSSTGQGMSYYTLLTVGGLNGIFEHLPDGSTKLAGGNYGFDAGAASLLVNYGQQQQYQIQLQTKTEQAAQAAKLSLATPPALPNITPAAPAPTTSTNPQNTISTQSIQPTFNPQPASSQSTNILQPVYNPQNGSGAKGISLSQPKLPGIRL